MENKKAQDHSTTAVKQGEYVITGAAGEVWSLGGKVGVTGKEPKDRFEAKYVVATTSSDGTHGTCNAKPDGERMVMEMNHDFIVWTEWSGAQMVRIPLINGFPKTCFSNLNNEFRI